VLKINTESNTLSLVPIDPDLLADSIPNKTISLQGRIEGGSEAFGFSDDVLLTSSSRDLRDFLGAHADDKDLFSDKDALQFHRQ
jgi:hypothetical protein